MELGAVEQLAEDQRDLGFHDARTVVLHGHPKPIRLSLLEVHPDLRDDARLFAGVERVVDRFLDGGQQRLAGVVEAQQVAVLGEELADRDIALLGRHGFGRGAPPRLAVAARPPRLHRRAGRCPRDSVVRVVVRRTTFFSLRFTLANARYSLTHRDSVLGK